MVNGQSSCSSVAQVAACREGAAGGMARVLRSTATETRRKLETISRGRRCGQRRRQSVAVLRAMEGSKTRNGTISRSVGGHEHPKILRRMSCGEGATLPWPSTRRLATAAYLSLQIFLCSQPCLRLHTVESTLLPLLIPSPKTVKIIQSDHQETLLNLNFTLHRLTVCPLWCHTRHK